MTSHDLSDDEPTIYAVCISETASRQIAQEEDRFAEMLGEPFAGKWSIGLYASIGTLATYPERCAVAPEDELKKAATLRQHLYRRTRTGPAWRILFTVNTATSDDPPTVYVELVLHGAQAPLTEWPSNDNDGLNRT